MAGLLEAGQQHPRLGGVEGLVLDVLAHRQ